jgi:hypothetical protein
MRINDQKRHPPLDGIELFAINAAAPALARRASFAGF